MTLNLSDIPSFMWIVGGVAVLAVAFVVIRFFWQHVIKVLLKVGVFILLILALAALLRYLGIL